MDSAHKETALSCGEAHAGDALDKPASGTIIAYMADQTRIPQEVEAKLLAPRAATLSAIAQLKNLGLYRLRPR
ncbi:MAG: hypothetical protein HYZ72_10555, partial [Deltaproteobacteria bacterium]|nr:hypothetical protein [Deltaproteobacteria bacterium]